jgi:hypothetical protein
MGHVPSKIPQISALFKITLPLLATSHGGGALVAMVVMGAEVPGSNPRAFPPTAYAYSFIYMVGTFYMVCLIYGWRILYGMFNIWLTRFIWYVLTYGLGVFYMICFNICFGFNIWLVHYMVVDFGYVA